MNRSRRSRGLWNQNFLAAARLPLSFGGGADMPQPVHKPGDIVPGDLFEDCRYHPCLCYDVGDPGQDAVFGISLIGEGKRG